jgi:hypothetical protein
MGLNLVALAGLVTLPRTVQSQRHSTGASDGPFQHFGRVHQLLVHTAHHIFPTQHPSSAPLIRPVYLDRAVTQLMTLVVPAVTCTLRALSEM